MSPIPVVNISPFTTGMGDRPLVTEQIQQACQDWGFFYIIGHGVEEQLQHVEELSRQFFAHEFRGTYGDYVLNKVPKAFPMLRQAVL